MVDLLVFELDRRRYALPAASVERVVHAVDIVPLPAAPSIIVGLIVLQGRPIAVADLRQRFGLPGRPMRLTDRLIIANSGRRTVALHLDANVSLVHVPRANITEGGEIVEHAEQIAGLVRMPDGVVLIHDLESLLSADEEAVLAAALTGGDAVVDEATP